MYRFLGFVDVVLTKAKLLLRDYVELRRATVGVSGEQKI